MLPLFPTPYPDEILYSVLCRYHSRCGFPQMRRTNIELWGSGYGKKLFLPDGIERIAAQIPSSANLTTERFIRDTTIFPFLKPFLSETRAITLWNDMSIGNKNIYGEVGFFRVFLQIQRCLRYCKVCIADDTAKYGEPYWHRLHQFPGIYVCHRHDVALCESDISIADVRNGCYPLLSEMNGAELSFDLEHSKKLFAIASDLDWISQNSGEVGYYGDTLKSYDEWLRACGYRDHNNKTAYKRLAEALVGYYGQEFLSMQDAYNSGACSWTRKITMRSQSLLHPVLHILLMRFFAGSVKKFFMESPKIQTFKYMPFGEQPYPCRNYLCDYHLQDVIADIEVVHTQKGDYKATFLCPHCGFAYRRRKAIPKEEQRTGQIDIVDYGYKWEETVFNRLVSSISPYKIAREVHCDVRTILDFAVKNKLLPPECLIKRKKYVPAESSPKRSDFNSQRELYRTRYLNAIAQNPKITRNELRMLDSKADRWLHLNDRDWYESHSPMSRKHQPEWAGDDENYAERIESAVNSIRDTPGRPKQISISAIGRLIEDGNIHRKLASGRLPKSKAVVDANAETLEDWQRRKILWAVANMREHGEVITVYKVRHRATIEDKERKWDEFILQCIINSE